MASPTVVYTWMTIDETSGHSWITNETTHYYDDARIKILDQQIADKFHKDVREQLKLAKKTSVHHCSFILKTLLGRKRTKSVVLATARLYSRKGEKDEVSVVS